MPSKYLLLLILLGAVIPHTALALMPPDLLFSVGASVVQFFSITAVVIGGVFSSIVYTSRRWLVLSPKRTWLFIGCIMAIVVLAIITVYLLEGNKQEEAYLARINLLESANTSLEQLLRQSVPLSEYQQLLELVDQGSLSFTPTIIVSTTSSSGFEREFHSDNIILYGTRASSSFALEIDFNRVESSAGVFTHYTSMNGNLFGEPIADYSTVYASTSVLQQNRYVKQIERKISNDLSPRDVYRATVMVNGEPLSFMIDGLKGDFITRHRPTYTQYQSIGTAKVTYQGETFTTQALVEGAYSMDYSKQIFFPGYQEVDATTHQFVLWDEESNFYLIDISDVRSDVPQYPSHIWLLYKAADGSGVQKSFAATVETVIDDSGRVSWEVVTPEFEDARLTLTPVVPYKQTGEERIRTAVGGIIHDNQGRRTIGGVLHLIE